MKVLVVDHATKSGWVYGEIKDGIGEIISFGKFTAKGDTEKEKVVSLYSNTKQLIASNQFMEVDVIVFEEPFAGSTLTSYKTLRSSYGRRYLFIEIAGSLRPSVELYGIKPNAWFKELPDEVKLSKTEFSKTGKPTKLKGKEKKKKILEFMNETYALGLEWHNEGVKCDNDIADAMAIFWLLSNNKLKGKMEKIG